MLALWVNHDMSPDIFNTVLLLPLDHKSLICFM